MITEKEVAALKELREWCKKYNALIEVSRIHETPMLCIYIAGYPNYVAHFSEDRTTVIKETREDF